MVGKKTIAAYRVPSFGRKEDDVDKRARYITGMFSGSRTGAMISMVKNQRITILSGIPIEFRHLEECICLLQRWPEAHYLIDCESADAKKSAQKKSVETSVIKRNNIHACPW